MLEIKLLNINSIYGLLILKPKEGCIWQLKYLWQSSAVVMGTMFKELASREEDISAVSGSPSQS